MGNISKTSMNSRKSKRVIFAETVDTINVKLYSRTNKDKHVPLNWYTKDELKSFRQDAKNISKAFRLQRVRRKRNGIDKVVTLLRSKTICTLGLENRINCRRLLQKDLVIRKVLNAQKKLKIKYASPTLEFHLATVSVTSTFRARRQALSDGRSVSQQGCSDTEFPLNKQSSDDVSCENFVLPFLHSNKTGRKFDKDATMRPGKDLSHSHKYSHLSMNEKPNEQICQIPKAA